MTAEVLVIKRNQVCALRKEPGKDNMCPPKHVHDMAYAIAASPTSPVFIASVRKNATAKKTIDSG